MPSSTPKNLQLKNYDVFIFDLDGTLYDQNLLRKKIIRALLFRLLSFRVKFLELKIIQNFRRLREEHKAYAAPQLDEEQYSWCAEKLNIPAVKVRAVIEKWMLEFPLDILLSARYPGVDEFFQLLHRNNKRIVVYSDFPVENKLKALDLNSDKNYCSTFKPIEQLKPGKKAIELICKELSCSPEKIIYIGDREDTDGESARMAGIAFIKVEIDEARNGLFYKQLLNQSK